MKEYKYEIVIFFMVLIVSAVVVEWKKELVRKSRSEEITSVLSLLVGDGVPVSAIILEPQKFLVEKMVTLKSCQKKMYCANISQKEKKYIKAGQAILDAKDESSFGTVISVASARNFNNGLFRMIVKANKKNEKKKIASKIVTKVIENVISIPNSSVVLEKDGFFVWRVNSDNETATKTKVEIGSKSSSFVEITSGLSEGDKIVSRGAGQVSKYQKLKIMETKKSSEINITAI